jgi:hypothetical protein
MALMADQVVVVVGLAAAQACPVMVMKGRIHL